MSNISNHIPFAQLVDLVEGRSPLDELVARSHVATCPRCAAEVAWLERVIGLMRSDTAEQPPADAVAVAKRLFRPPVLATRRQLMATLQFDSARTPVGLGRRAGAQAERQLLFVVSDHLIDLRIAPHGPLWVVSGQLLGAEDGRQVELNGSAGTAQAMLNDLNEFALPPAASGTYTLRVQLTDLDILIAGLEVGR